MNMTEDEVTGTFRPNMVVTVENSRTGQRYRAEVLEVDGTRITCALPGAGGMRPFTFDLDDNWTDVDDTTIFSSW
jgi:hypothetical protein